MIEKTKTQQKIDSLVSEASHRIWVYVRANKMSLNSSRANKEITKQILRCIEHVTPHTKKMEMSARKEIEVEHEKRKQEGLRHQATSQELKKEIAALKVELSAARGR